MTCSRLTRWVAVILTAGCPGCELVDVEGQTAGPAEKTYPPALDLPAVDLSTVRSSSDVPDSFNVNVRVAAINVCPEGMRCFIPNGITVAENGDNNSKLDTVHVVAMQPHQFEVNRAYIMSLRPLYTIYNDSTGAKTAGGSFGLIGYSPVENVPAASH